MAKISFRNRNGERDPKRPIKNGISTRAEAQVRQLNGLNYATGSKKLTNDVNGIPALEPVSQAPTTIEKPLVAIPQLSEAEQEAATKAVSGGAQVQTDAEKAAAEKKATENPTSATPAVSVANTKPAKPAKVRNSIYPHTRGNYQSALSSIRVKLMNDCGDMDDEDEDDEANDESGMPNTAASKIIYGGQDLSTPASALVVTTQAPAVQ